MQLLVDVDRVVSVEERVEEELEGEVEDVLEAVDEAVALGMELVTLEPGAALDELEALDEVAK